MTNEAHLLIDDTVHNGTSMTSAPLYSPKGLYLIQ